MSDKRPKPVVMIVDDTPTNVRILAEALRSDYRVRVASSGMTALDMIDKKSPPDLILLDIMMPEMDGYEVCRRLKNDPATKNIPLIFVTAMSDVINEEKGLKLGAIDYIVKPFHIPVVVARVRNHINAKLKSDMLESLAMLDGLTGIPNRRQFDNALQDEWLRARREHHPLSIILADIDHFKPYNDHYGHGAGDVCLIQVAEVIADAIKRPGDLVARYGGEEFVALLPNTDFKGARMVAERIRQLVETLRLPHEYSEISPLVTISVGFASALPSDNDEPEVLLEHADRMLYQAKREGRNRICGSQK